MHMKCTPLTNVMISYGKCCSLLHFHFTKKVLLFIPRKRNDTNAAAGDVLKYTLFNCSTIQYLIWYVLISLLVMCKESVSVCESFVSLGKVWQTTKFL